MTILFRRKTTLLQSAIGNLDRIAMFKRADALCDVANWRLAVILAHGAGNPIASAGTAIYQAIL